MATINNVINSQHGHKLKPPQNCQEFVIPHLFDLTIYPAKKKKKKQIILKVCSNAIDDKW